MNILKKIIFKEKLKILNNLPIYIYWQYNIFKLNENLNIILLKNQNILNLFYCIGLK